MKPETLIQFCTAFPFVRFSVLNVTYSYLNCLACVENQSQPQPWFPPSPFWLEKFPCALEDDDNAGKTFAFRGVNKNISFQFFDW